jgi:NAD(P)-dependent dehydrogenase (short-subunit alcohol dehydrogenase family)
MKVVVTGGNTGIGFALCKQLVLDHNAHVFLTARNPEKGRNAVSKIQLLMEERKSQGSISFVPMDTTDDQSVLNASKLIGEELGSNAEKLYGLVNNAGVGLNTALAPEGILNTNLYGPQRVCEAFVNLIDEEKGRIVNLGSGSGPSYTSGCRDSDKKLLCNPDKCTWEQIEQHANENANGQYVDVYGLSKALLACYTGFFANQYPNILSSCVTPGFINTQMTAGYGASKAPDQGTSAIKHCLLDELQGNGWYYGSDGIRSPYHFMRSPGEPPYDGKGPY